MSACDTCAAPIVWARSQTTGKAMPLNAEPVDPGSPYALVLADGIAWWPPKLAEHVAARDGLSTARALEVIGETLPWHVSHFATCPNAAKHRRRR